MSWTEDYGSGTFLNYDMSWLQRDEYYLNIINNSTHRTLYFYSKYEECYKVGVVTFPIKLTFLFSGYNILNKQTFSVSLNKQKAFPQTSQY